MHARQSKGHFSLVAVAASIAMCCSTGEGGQTTATAPALGGYSLGATWREVASALPCASGGYTNGKWDPAAHGYRLCEAADTVGLTFRADTLERIILTIKRDGPVPPSPSNLWRTNSAEITIALGPPDSVVLQASKGGSSRTPAEPSVVARWSRAKEGWLADATVWSGGCFTFDSMGTTVGRCWLTIELRRPTAE